MGNEKGGCEEEGGGETVEEENMNKLRVFAIWLAGATLAVEGYAGEKMAVVIIDRQDNQSTYSYVIPGRSITNSQAGADCSTAGNSVNCSGRGTSTTMATPAVAGQFTVSGATFSLQLPDGRIAVVNCASKPKMNYNNMTQRTVRSCRTPITDTITAEFDGGNAKLIWPAGIDGKKTESETYKIVAIIAK